MMNAEIVAIGTELLLGQIVDTNAVYMAEHLKRIGVHVCYKTTVGDDPDRMREVLAHALERADVVITCGGLGPTEDDLTRDIAAEVTGRELIFHLDLLEHIQDIFRERQFPFRENNRRQAYIPEHAIPIKNPQGTAPGYIIEAEQGILISLPGVPREMKYLMQETVLPYLTQKMGKAQVIHFRVLKLCGIGESTVDYAIRDIITSSVNPSIGLLAHVGQIDIRLTATAENEAQADALIAGVEAQIRERLPYQIFGVDNETQESVILTLLRERGLTLAVAETNTGGYIAQQFSLVPDANSVFRGGVFAPDTHAVQHMLTVPAEELESHDFIGPETSTLLAQRIKDQCCAHIGIGITGHRQSQSGTISDPAVSGFMAIAKADGTCVTQEYRLAGPPDIIQTRMKNMTLELLRRILLDIEHHFT